MNFSGHDFPGFWAVEGIIGVGKSTLARRIAEQLRGQVFLEPIKDHPILPLFYKNMRSWSYPLQMDLMTRRHRQVKDIIRYLREEPHSGRHPRVAIQDRTVDGDMVFAKLLNDQGDMDDVLYGSYLETVRDYIRDHIVDPDVILFLRVEPTIAHERILKRMAEDPTRQYEQAVPLDYLERLAAGYEKMIHQVSQRTKVIEINWNRYGSASDVIFQVRERFGLHWTPPQSIQEKLPFPISAPSLANAATG